MVFDLDGTLVHHVNPRVLQLLEFLDDCSHGVGRLVARLRLARRNRAKSGKPPRLLVHRALHKVRRKSVAEMLAPCETLRQTLETLRANGVVLALVSNGMGRGYGHDVLDAFDLRRYFSTCVFREDVARGKPWPDSLIKAVSSLGRNLRRSDVIWYVGDQRKDLAAAQAASAELGRPIQPIALGARAAMAALEFRLPAHQVMLAPGDLERLVQRLFEPEFQPLFDPLPAPLL